MMRALVLLHRWLGVAFCLLFAMWFATGMVMHFVPFPSLMEAERIAGLASVDSSANGHGPADAAGASKLADARRIRLVTRPDGSVYVVSGASQIVVLHAADLSPAAVPSASLALEIAVDHARRRGLDTAKAAVVDLAANDQWTVPNRFDPYRPLFRVALNDAVGTELYVSSATGEVLLDTTRHERLWNYAGSVVHWIYPTVLRSNWAVWDRTVWSLSLAALVAAVSGALLGIIRIRKAWRRITTMPLRGWHPWHHVLGLLTMSFVLTWSVSGWLSMDHGRLFSRDALTRAEAAGSASAPAWSTLPPDSVGRLASGTREVEWFALGQAIYQRERTGLATQVLRRVDDGATENFLSASEIGVWIGRFAGDCLTPFVIATDDSYPAASVLPRAPVYRSVCGSVWFHIDGANGAILQRLDASRRVYRWAYGALHTMDIPVLLAHPRLRSTVIIALCACGLIFSVTGVVLGWRRLRIDAKLRRFQARAS